MDFRKCHVPPAVLRTVSGGRASRAPPSSFLPLPARATQRLHPSALLLYTTTLYFLYLSLHPKFSRAARPFYPHFREQLCRPLSPRRCSSNSLLPHLSGGTPPPKLRSTTPSLFSWYFSSQRAVREKPAELTILRTVWIHGLINFKTRQFFNICGNTHHIQCLQMAIKESSSI